MQWITEINSDLQMFKSIWTQLRGAVDVLLIINLFFGPALLDIGQT